MVATPLAGTITAIEWGGDNKHITELTITSVPLIVTTNASKGDGKPIYTLPAGKVIIKSAAMNIGIVGTAALNVADTPDLGLGTVVASGAVSVLSGTATFENIMTGQTVGACANTKTVAAVDTILSIPTANAHTVYLNIADGWAGIDAGMLATGKIVLEWQYLD